MLAKPDLPDEKIAACLQHAYGLSTSQIEFLPLGVDNHAAVYRVVAQDGTSYFLKLRRGLFDEVAVLLPKYLGDQDIPQIIAPLPTCDGQLWADVDEFRGVLYPFVEGSDGYTVELTDDHWRELGAALRRIHTATLPPTLVARIRQEDYPPRWRDGVRALLANLDGQPQHDAIAEESAAFLKDHAAVILDLVGRADRLARRLQAQPPALTVCHSDLHAGNVLIGVDGRLYIVDWDNPIRAAKERDLMFAGGYQFGGKRTPAEEEQLFYEGYGAVAVNPVALAYYRYIRILEDIVLFCEDIFQMRVSDEDRAQSLHYLKFNFLPSATIAVALHGDRT